jgi:signal transduction histidine kinase
MGRAVAGVLLSWLAAAPGIAAAIGSPAIPGEVSCDRGVDIARVKALVGRTVQAMKQDRGAVLQAINHGDPRWKDGDYYMFVAGDGRLLAHGFLSSYVGQRLGSLPWGQALQRMAMERNEGCVGYQFMNPAKGGQTEDKVGYVVKVDATTWAGSGTYLVRK